jgi:hypothetical protein
MTLWPAPRGRMDDWSVSAKARAAANGQATNLPQSVTLTQARFFMDDGTWPLVGLLDRPHE